MQTKRGTVFTFPLFEGRKEMKSMIDICLCGALGKMGRVLNEIISARDDCRVTAGIDFADGQADFPIVASPDKLSAKPDVIIDFSHPSALGGLLDYCLTNNVPLVAATTGYSQEDIARIKAAGSQIGVFFTWNMSMGINLLVTLARKAAGVLGGQFDIEILEKHHNQKLDAPSGTALMLADAINGELDERCSYIYDRHSVRRKRSRNEIGIHSVRGGTIVGEHDVIFAGRDEVITLSHQAASKQVFAVGAVNAAVFLANQPAGLYDMNDLMRQSEE